MPNLEDIKIVDVNNLNLRSLASSKSLKKVTIDKEKVSGWEYLEQAGITVIDE